MKKYEYKFANIKSPLGFDWEKKIQTIEEQWNELGREGWQFCMQSEGFLVFMREIQE